MTVSIPSVIPAVETPVFYADDQVEDVIAIVVGISPLIVSNFGAFGLLALGFVKVRRDT